MMDQNTKKKTFARKALAFLFVICMMMGLMVPAMSVTASAAEPSADVWDGSRDTSWYNSKNTQFTIYTAEQLAGLAYLVNNGNTFSGKTIYLGNNIDLANREWTPIGKGVFTDYHSDSSAFAPYFSGTFAGNYFVISNLTIANCTTTFNGLFGVTNYATIVNVGVDNVNIFADVGSYRGQSGSIVGCSVNSTIDNCFAKGSIGGINKNKPAAYGGIVGLATSSQISNCYAVVDISANGHCGGIVGGVYYGPTTVSNCYAWGEISRGNVTGYGILVAGGIVSYTESSLTINNSFFIGSVDADAAFDGISTNRYSTPTITNCYHSFSGDNDNRYTNASNFESQVWIESNLGWDFDTVWEFRAGNDYPVLQGFGEGGGITPHTHTFEETSRTEPTCTVDGRINYECSCGETKVGVIPAIGHNIETTVEVQVTCTTDGLIVDRCVNDGCDYEKRTVIHGEHNYSITDRKNAACETPGYVEYTCSNCGDKKYEYFDGAHNYVESARVEPQVEVEGTVTYTCTYCGDSYSIVLPALTPVLKNSSVLLIQDSLPWAEDVNTSLLETLKSRGVVSSYNIISTNALASFDLSQYGVVFIANDQTTAMYQRLAANAEKLENYVRAGGNLIYGACDSGWGGCGSLTHALLGGVTTSNYYSVHNYIVNDLHPIVTGVYTDNKSLRDDLLKGNYCSHTYFNAATLPAGSNIILRDANGNPTLVEYALGDGIVMASGLTWEYFYVRNHYNMNTNYSKYVYDDLVTYMVYMSNTCEHNYEIVKIVEATCEKNGYTKYVCTLCSHEYMGDIVVAPGHNYVLLDHTPATCCRDGAETYVCSLCGDTYTNTLKQIDHHFVTGNIILPPTCTEEGLKNIDECDLPGCELVYITALESIPALGHNYVNGICSRCGEKQPSADVWDGTIDTSWYNSTDTEFTIYTAEQLAGLAYLVNNGNTFSGKTIYLGNNIDLNGREWTPIGAEGIATFSGTFDGQYHVVRNLSMEKTTGIVGYGIGFFGMIQCAVVRNVGIENATITVNSGRVGIVCGVAESNTLIENCYATGSITLIEVPGYEGGIFAGGFVGDMQGGTIRVRNCYASSQINANIPNARLYVGGFVGIICGNGYSDGFIYGDSKYIDNCYSNSTIVAPASSNSVGGFIGQLYYGEFHVNNSFDNSTVNGSYNKSFIGSKGEDIQYCYIDGFYYNQLGNSEHGGTPTSAGNFRSETWIKSNLGWDFNNVWEFRTGHNYPVLRGFGKGPHTHAFVETSRTEATCTTNGRINYACSCGETKVVVILASGHNIQTTVEIQVTCTSDGLIVDRCVNNGCNYEKRTVIHGEHNYSITNRKAATCETPGYIEYTCSNCGDKNYEYIEGRHNYVETSRTEAQVGVEGSIIYTCTECGDSYSVAIPALNPVLKNSAVLLIQNSLPWAENVNTSLLETLKGRGVVSYYNIINTSALASTDLTQYGVVFIANDQTTSMYNGLAANATKLENYVRAGGNLIYGACDEGWGGCGSLTHDLPGGVKTSNYYSVHNYIVNGLHPIVTGVYTDNRSLADELLKGNYCSHTYFNNATLPAGTDVILRDANGNPTLIEYNLGDGTVIASGLTWEYFYVRNHYNMITNYSKYAYDDLVTYMVYMSNTCEHNYEMVEIVAPTCEENGYTKYVCTLCSHEYMGDIVLAPGHNFVEVSRVRATCTTNGRINYACSCGETKVVVILASGHNIQTTVEIQVTCTSDGLIVDRCVNNGCNYEKRTVIHGEHNYSITDRKNAACETPGYVEYTCSNCGDKKYEYFDGAHNYVESARVEPQIGVEGRITYTCTLCGDSYVITLPALTPVLKNSSVLLIQDSLPWAENVNRSLLETLKTRGVVSSYNIINTSALASFDLTQYGVVFIANDQTTSMYNGLAANAAKLENYVRAGGNLIYGACDEGWGGCGSLTHTLPGGVKTSNYYSVHNYIVNGLHPIVTGVYTDNRSLADELLKGNYCSHTYFNNATLPAGTDVILRDANGNPTLIEYNLGDGTVIASGLTWEYFYVRNHYNMITNYSKYAYDDLVTYMVYMSNTCEHNYEMVEIVAPTCEENGYTKYVCTLCSHEYMGDIVLAPGHNFVETSRVEATCTTMGEIRYTCFCGAVKVEPIGYADHIASGWIVDVPATCVSGRKHKECTVCHTVLENAVIDPVSDHIAGDWIVDVEPTATQTGRRHKECIVCHSVLETEIIPILARLVISDVEAKPGSTVRVTIDIQNNPGIIGAILTLNYDPALKLLRAEAGAAWNSLNLTMPQVLSNSCNFVWDGVDGADFSNGSIIVLTFEVPKDAAVGTVYNISASYTGGNVINDNLEAVDLAIKNGSITVINPIGDANDDGVVDVADVIVLRRYLAGGYGVAIDTDAADVNRDGFITIADIVLLRRSLVG